MLWAQKSREKWFKNGDRNASYFHLSTVVRRRRNKIEGLMDDNQTWIFSKKSVKRVVADYFNNLFLDCDSPGIPRTWPRLFPNLIKSDMKDISNNVTIKEIKEALFHIGKYKTPGPDGVPVLFFQNHWNICSKDIYSLIYDSFETASIPCHLNETFLVLVPKNELPISMKQIRPISLCNTLYKIISKILVNRIRPILKDLINPTQASFILGRQISDNIIIAHENMNKYRRSKGKKSLLAWEVIFSRRMIALIGSSLKIPSIRLGLIGKLPI